MTNQRIDTISEFLLHAGTDYRVFDMSRCIRSLSSQTLLDMETGKSAPELVRLQHVWLGIIFWDKTRSKQHYIWFIKLPVDEQGLVIPAARHQFLQIIVEALGKGLEKAEEKNAQLPDNPFTFIPNQHQLADFNSISRKALGLGFSQFFTQAKAYIDAPLVLDWQQVALQGITDYAANIDNNDLLTVLLDNFDKLSPTVACELLKSCENQPVPEKLAHKIQLWLQANPQNSAYWQAGLRALAQSPCDDLVQVLLNQVLESDLRSDSDVLVIISGRLWMQLLEPAMLNNYLIAVAQADKQHSLFCAVFSDLVQLPALRHQLLGLLRQADRPAEISAAIGTLFSGSAR